MEALTNRTIFAAGLDVMTPEPLPYDHPLVKLDNCGKHLNLLFFIVQPSSSYVFECQACTYYLLLFAPDIITNNIL